MPESNPDGARLTFFDAGQRMWRKNLRPPTTAGGCAGVDCNRNFPRYFGEAGSSSNPCAETYRGPAALSEPEAANIAHLVAKERRLLFAVDSHSHGQAIFRPGPNGGTYVTSLPVSAEDDAIYRHLEEAMKRGIRRVQGVNYSTGTTSNHAGTTDEYLFFDHHVFAFDLECGEDFQPPEADAVRAAREVAEAVRALGWCATGETGLDVAGLLTKRPAASVPAAPPTDAESVRWDVVPPPYEWRRFRVRLEVTDAKTATKAVRQLEEEGFDLEYEGRNARLELVASAKDLERLLRLGYNPQLEADLLEDPDRG